jgi:hypothetical protein
MVYRIVENVPNSIFLNAKLIPESLWMGNIDGSDWPYIKYDATDGNMSWSNFFSLTKERAGVLLNQLAMKSKKSFGLEFVLWVCYLKRV